MEGDMLKELESWLRWTMDSILRWPLLFWGCVIANLVGTVFGVIVWYGPMLQASPLWTFPFIPDCPLAALLGSIGLLALRGRRRWSFFYALVAFACIKYGVWTVAYWLREWSVGGFYGDPMEVVLFITHIGLLIEGLLFVPHIGPLSPVGRAGVIGWFALSIYVDYGLGFHPPLGAVTVTFAATTAIVMTLLCGVGLLLLPYRESPPVVMSELAS
jgi:uncharacterized membrane protein YpjA